MNVHSLFSILQSCNTRRGTYKQKDMFKLKKLFKLIQRDNIFVLVTQKLIKISTVIEL